MKLSGNSLKSAPSKGLCLIFAFFLFPLFIAIAHFTFVSNFIVEPKVSLFAFYTALFISIPLCIGMLVLIARGKSQAGTVTRPVSWFKKLVAILLVPILLVGTYWIIFALVIPYQFTRLTGHSFEQQMQIRKVVSSRRYRNFLGWRHFEIRLADSGPISVFRFRISESSYNKIPDGTVESVFVGLKGELGIVVKSIEITTNASP